MDKIITLGNAASNFGDSLKKLAPKIYDVYKIDRNLSGDNCLSLPDYGNWDDYVQKDLGEYKDFLTNIQGKKLFVTSCGAVSGASLRILEHLDPEQTTVLYIAPDTTIISSDEAMRNKVVFGVLQEYARSGAVRELFCISNKLADLYCPNLTISRYLEGLNEYMASVFHWYNIFQNTRSIISGSSWSEFNKIATLGISEVDLAQEEIFEKNELLFDLQGKSEKHYYYAIPEKTLEEEVGLHRKLKEHVKNLQTKEISTTFSVFSNDHDRPFCIIVQKTRDIQKTT